MKSIYKYEDWSNERIEKENISTLLLSPKKRQEYLSYWYNKDFCDTLFSNPGLSVDTKEWLKKYF